jgi:hypothetical protein
MERPLYLKTAPVLTRFDSLFSMDDAKGRKKPPPGHCGPFFAHFLPKYALCGKIPRIMREKNTRLLHEIRP